MANPPRDEELERFKYKYDPELARLPERNWGWIIMIGLLGIVLGVGVTLGLVRWQANPVGLLPAAPSELKADATIAGAIDEVALLLVDTDATTSQIKIAKTTTDTVVVQDVTREKVRALAAALSPHKDQVVYLDEEDGNRAAAVIDIDTGLSRTLSRDKLAWAAQGNRVEPCSWSPVAWSPNGEHFAFFGCSSTASILVVVAAGTELTPVVLKNTEAGQEPSRQVFWLDDEHLIYTHLDTATKQMRISRTGIQAKAVPVSIYEP